MFASTTMPEIQPRTRHGRLTSLHTAAVAAASSRPACSSRSSPDRRRTPDPAPAAGRHRNQRRRRGLPDQRRAGDCRDDRLLHADRRRPVRLRRHRRDQRHLRRLRDGRAPALRAGAGGDADRQAAARARSGGFSKAANRSASGRAFPSPAATASIRSSRSTAWLPSAWSIHATSSATRTAKPGDKIVLGKALGVGRLRRRAQEAADRPTRSTAR